MESSRRWITVSSLFPAEGIVIGVTNPGTGRRLWWFWLRFTDHRFGQAELFIGPERLARLLGRFNDRAVQAFELGTALPEVGLAVFQRQ
jgi:hypothetical protein